MWNFIVEFWNTVIFEPIFNLIVALIAFIPGHNFGVALILFTLITRFILYPLTKKQFHSLRIQKELQPEINKIKKENKDNKQAAALATMALYKERGFNPFASLGYLFLQIPIFIGLYQVINRFVKDVVHNVGEHAYSFIQNLSWVKDLKANPEIFDSTFLGLVDLTRPAVDEAGFYLAAFIIVVLATASQYLISKQMTLQAPSIQGKPLTLRQLFKRQAAGKEVDQSDIQAATSKLFTYMLPIFIFVFSIGWAAALPFYWFISGISQYFQQRKLNEAHEGTKVKSSINGQETIATIEKPLNAKQKRQQKKAGFKTKEATPKKVKAHPTKNKSKQKGSK